MPLFKFFFILFFFSHCSSKTFSLIFSTPDATKKNSQKIEKNVISENILDWNWNGDFFRKKNSVFKKERKWSQMKKENTNIIQKRDFISGWVRYKILLDQYYTSTNYDF